MTAPAKCGVCKAAAHPGGDCTPADLPAPAEDIHLMMATFVSDCLPAYQEFSDKVRELSAERDESLKRLADAEAQIAIRRHEVWEMFQQQCVELWGGYLNATAKHRQTRQHLTQQLVAIEAKS